MKKRTFKVWALIDAKTGKPYDFGFAKWQVPVLDGSVQRVRATITIDKKPKRRRPAGGSR
jgi:hypothetical protein